MAENLQLVLTTPETTLLDEPVDGLRFPLFDGQIGILPGRAPLVGRLGHGELKVSRGGNDTAYFIDGGFVQIKGEVVSLLTDRAIPLGDLTQDEARKIIAEAEELPALTDEEYVTKQRELDRGRAMADLAAK